MHPKPFRLASFVLVSLALLASSRAALSLPSFSRALDLPCAHCHTATPRLGAAGIDFQQNGYRLATAHSGSAPRITEPLFTVQVGANLAVRPGAAGSSPNRTTTVGRLRGDAFEVDAVGVFADRLSYHTSVDRQLNDDDLSWRGFVQVDDLLSSGRVNLRAGRFDTGIPFLSGSAMVQQLSPVTFDARGVELNGQRSDWTYAAGWSLSGRHTSGGPSPHSIASPLEDTYFRVMRGARSHPIAAQVLFDRQDSRLPTLSWVQHLRAQIAASLGPPRFSLIPSYMFDRLDDRPEAGLHERHQHYRLEAPALLDTRGRWAMTAAYEHEYRTGNPDNPGDHRELEALDLAWQASSSARFGAEWSRAGDTRVHPMREELDAYVRASW